MIVEQSGVAIAAALAGLVVLLLIGTQILDWYWLVLVFAGSLAFGVWRTMSRVPSRYVLAQQIDHRLGLYDSISTAINFSTEDRPGSATFRSAQLGEAEALARTADLRPVFPYSFPKAAYAAGAVALVAAGMFAIRYGVTRSLDLKPSLVRIAMDTFFKTEKEAAAPKKSPWRQKIDDDLDPNPNNALNAIDTPNVNNQGDSDTAKSQVSSVPNERESTDPGGQDKTEQASANGSEKAGNDQPPEGSEGQPQNGKPQSQPKGGKQSNGDNASMMDKMRDAMSDLLNKLKMSPKSGEAKQSAQNSQQGKGQQGKADKGQMPGKQQSASADAQNQGEQSGDPSQSAAGKSGDKNSDKQASQDAKSGIGKQDGDKSAREAEQLAAMGKISEILGKRAQNMSGEVMVEVSSGKQQLKTQYSSHNSTHVEAGGEISRDEVPIEYREYVQQYFEQIRKLPVTAAAKPKTSAVDASPVTQGAPKKSE